MNCTFQKKAGKAGRRGGGGRKKFLAFSQESREKQDPSIPLGYAEIYSPGQLSIYLLYLSLSISK